MSLLALLRVYAQRRNVVALAKCLGSVLSTDKERQLISTLGKLLPLEHREVFNKILNFRPVTLDGSEHQQQQGIQEQNTSTRTVTLRKLDDGYGLILEGGNPIRISEVAPGGAASQMGLKSGEVILNLNGTDVRTYGQQELMQLINDRDRQMTLKIMTDPLDVDTDKQVKPSKLQSERTSQTFGSLADALLTATEKKCLRETLVRYNNDKDITRLVENLEVLLSTPERQELWEQLLPRIATHHKRYALRKVKEARHHMDSKPKQEQPPTNRIEHTGPTRESSVVFIDHMTRLLNSSEQKRLKKILKNYFINRDSDELFRRASSILSTPAKFSLWFSILPLLDEDESATLQAKLKLPVSTKNENAETPKTHATPIKAKEGDIFYKSLSTSKRGHVEKEDPNFIHECKDRNFTEQPVLQSATNSSQRPGHKTELLKDDITQQRKHKRREVEKRFEIGRSKCGEEEVQPGFVKKESGRLESGQLSFPKEAVYVRMQEQELSGNSRRKLTSPKKNLNEGKKEPRQHNKQEVHKAEKFKLKKIDSSKRNQSENSERRRLHNYKDIKGESFESPTQGKYVKQKVKGYESYGFGKTNMANDQKQEREYQPVVANSKRGKLQENIQANKDKLSRNDWDEIDETHRITRHAQHISAPTNRTEYWPPEVQPERPKTRHQFRQETTLVESSPSIKDESQNDSPANDTSSDSPSSTYSSDSFESRALSAIDALDRVVAESSAGLSWTTGSSVASTPRLNTRLPKEAESHGGESPTSQTEVSPVLSESLSLSFLSAHSSDEEDLSSLHSSLFSSLSSSVATVRRKSLPATRPNIPSPGTFLGPSVKSYGELEVLH